MALVSTIRSRAKEPDQICADAFDLARRSLVEDARVSADTIGDYLGAEATADRVVTHFFDCADPGYTGWRWAVTVTRAPRSKVVTVDESVLLPGADSLLAPAWVPWQDRLRPGDVGIGDLLPASADDERLVPFVVLDGDDAVTDWFLPRTDSENADAGPRTAAEIEVPGRSRVLSAYGRDDAAERWYEGDHGPHTPLSEAAPANCVSCGFFVPLSGGLGRLFGACGNAFAPDDGRVVSADHGCGAHSEAVLTAAAAAAAAPVIDELGYDLVDLPGVSVEETVFEPLSRETYPESTAGPDDPAGLGDLVELSPAGGQPRPVALEEGHVPESEQAHRQTEGARPHPPARIGGQRVADGHQDREGDRPADRDDGGDLAIVRLLGRWRGAPLFGSALPALAHTTRLTGLSSHHARIPRLAPGGEET